MGPRSATGALVRRPLRVPTGEAEELVEERRVRRYGDRLAEEARCSSGAPVTAGPTTRGRPRRLRRERRTADPCPSQVPAVHDELVHGDQSGDLARQVHATDPGQPRPGVRSAPGVRQALQSSGDRLAERGVEVGRVGCGRLVAARHGLVTRCRGEGRRQTGEVDGIVATEVPGHGVGRSRSSSRTSRTTVATTSAAGARSGPGDSCPSVIHISVRSGRPVRVRRCRLPRRGGAETPQGGRQGSGTRTPANASTISWAKRALRPDCEPRNSAAARRAPPALGGHPARSRSDRASPAASITARRPRDPARG